MMNYGNPFLNPYGQQFMPTVQQPAQQVVRVSGENGARAYQLPPNSSALLLDETGVIIWLVTSDGAGYKTVSAYDIQPHKTETAREYSDLESRVKKLEEMIGGMSNGNTGNSSAAGEGKSGGSTD